MKKYRRFGFAFRLVPFVFFTTLISCLLTGAIGILFFNLGILNFDRQNPFLILALFLLSSIIIGTILSFITSKRSFKGIDELVNAIDQIGKGNFDVEITEASRPEIMKNLTRDINRMAKELKNLEMMKSDFINDFSHEFKTPIVSISGFAKRLLTKDLSEEKQNEYIQIIYDEAIRLSNLSSNTLLMSKLENTDINYNQVVFKLDEQIRNAVILLEKKWLSKSLSINLNLDTLNYYGNEELMQQIWINILDNCIKYSKSAGNILVEGTAHDEGLVISIADEGFGMNDEVLKKVFDKFYQGDQSRKSDGNGLGLSIASKIVALHNGTIEITSKENIGTTFTISLPQKSNI